MRRLEPLLASAFERGMARHQNAALEDADFVSEDVDVEDPPPRRVRHAVTTALSNYVGGNYWRLTMSRHLMA